MLTYLIVLCKDNLRKKVYNGIRDGLMSFLISRLALQKYDLEDDTIKLVSNHVTKENYIYKIILKSTKKHIGYCDLRTGHNISLYYLGNIGYRIFPEYRGHGYAYRASLLLFKLARNLEMDYIIITVSPENTASIKTIEKLNCEYVETTDVPVWHSLYRNNEKVKMIYRYNLKED
jgi:predicted acetyltransferase